MKSMVIYIKPSLYITVVEGTGDNLTGDDMEHGYRDYVMTNIYEHEGCDLNEIDGGQMLSSTMIADMTDDELANKVLDFWGYKDKDYEILGVVEGE